MAPSTPPLHTLYPGTKSPLIISAPMYRISLSNLAATVTESGGLGFIGTGLDQSSLSTELDAVRTALNHPASSKTPLPVGVGLINWAANLKATLAAVEKYIPAAVWLFAPLQTADLRAWSDGIRAASHGQTAVWVQVGSVAQALATAEHCDPDVLVIQGSDAGGHGLQKGASLITLFPECADTLAEKGFGHIHLVAAGGISDGRGVAAAMALGAEGAVLGTRFIASHEAAISKEYQKDLLAAKDGGVSTVRSTVFDDLRGPNEWPADFDGRGLRDQSLRDHEAGMSMEENRELLKKDKARVTRYAGTGVGLVKKVEGAGDIVEELRREAGKILRGGL